MIATGPAIRKRIAILMAAFLFLFILLTGQLFNLQVLRADELQSRAQAQWTSESVIAPRRGTIYDRAGHVLALSATAYIASVSPRQVDDPEAFAQILAPILDMDAETIERRASDTSKGGVTLKRQLSRDIAQQLRTMYLEHRRSGSKALNGLYLEEDAKRYYPMGAFASQLLGLTSIDGIGQSGLESSLERYLSGRAGRILDEIDGRGREFGFGAREYLPSTDGGSVTLTLDYVIQCFVEQAAREALEVNGAAGVRILVMNPKTGEILALCNKPDFDLNLPPRNDVTLLNDLMRNRVIADAYEPGSTFKILTTAAALDCGVTNVNEGFYCSGSVVVEGGRIRCWGRPHGALNMAEGLCNSCNPVFVELGLRLGTERFYDYMHGFGLGMVTAVDIPGEAGGIVIPRSAVKRVDIARIGFGQSIAVTPLQLLTAASATVNGGYLMRPYIVREIQSQGGEVIERNEPLIVDQPVSPQTSQAMRMLLEKVVAEGGGRNAYIEGYRVGGKTGTAQVYKDGVISTDTHIGSFIGFAPMDDPQIAVLVIIDEARKRPDFGSVTAAPFAKSILEQSLRYLGVAKAGETAILVEVPDVTGIAPSDAISAVKGAGLQCVLDGDGSRVIDQLPAPGALMPEKSLVMLYVDEDGPEAERRVCVPDLLGMAVGTAEELLGAYRLSLYIEGSGIAVSQFPPAGEMVVPTTVITVNFQLPEG